MTTSSGLSKPNMYKISRGRTLNGEPNPIDVYIGQRIRVRRQLLGLSQEALAKKIGITFQQVQKYERGMNRIGASRLWDMMQVLGVDANYFFSGIDEELSRQSPRNLILSDNLPQVESENPIKSDIMQDTDFIRMARAYERIQNTQAGEYVRGLIFQILSGTFCHVISRGRCSCRAPCASSGFQLKSPDSVCRS